MHSIRTLSLVSAAALVAAVAVFSPDVFFAPVVGGLAMLVSVFMPGSSRSVFAARCVTAALGATLALSVAVAPLEVVLGLLRLVAVSLSVTVGAFILRPGQLSKAAACSFGVLLMGCEPACASGGGLSPGAKKTLEQVVSRVDVPRLLACAEAGDAKAVAKCLGARVLTEGLEEALLRATQLAEQAEEAGNEAAGASDITEAQKAALAVELDQALDDLATELARANAG